MGEGGETARKSDASRENGEAARQAAGPSGAAKPRGMRKARPAAIPRRPARPPKPRAILRIGAILDLDMVLNKVVACARPLTGAEYGGIATVDGNGEPRDFVTSGMTDEQRRALETWPHGLRLFARPRSLGPPLRLLDLDIWARARPRALPGALWDSDGRHDPTTRMLQPRFRTVSTFFASYYALFHRLVDEATRMMISGGQRKGIRQCLSRVFFHHDMKELCTPLAGGIPRQ